MVAGEKARLWIPAPLAYGDAPIEKQAPAGMLVFEIELLGLTRDTPGSTSMANASASAPIAGA